MILLSDNVAHAGKSPNVCNRPIAIIMVATILVNDNGIEIGFVDDPVQFTKAPVIGTDNIRALIA